MTPENELGIGAYFEVLQRYVCKNRLTELYRYGKGWKNELERYRSRVQGA